MITNLPDLANRLEVMILQSHATRLEKAHMARVVQELRPWAPRRHASHSRPRPYVGKDRFTGRWETFRSDVTPTDRTHGHRYALCVGPFRTARGARYMARNGAHTGNPHCVTVAQAERLASKCTCDDTPNSPAACPRHGKGFPP